MAQKLESCYLYEEHVSFSLKEDVRAGHMHSAVVTHAVVTHTVVTHTVITRAMVTHALVTLAVVTPAMVTHTTSIFRSPMRCSHPEGVHSGTSFAPAL